MGEWNIMSEKLFLKHSGTPQKFDFDPHGSGRYRQGSGEDPHQHRFDLLYEVEKMKKSGLYKNETEIARALGYSSGELRAIKTNLIAEKRAADAARALKMKERGLSNMAIAKKMGISDKKVASLLEEPESVKDQILNSTTDVLRKSIEDKKYICRFMFPTIAVMCGKIRTFLSLMTTCYRKEWQAAHQTAFQKTVSFGVIHYMPGMNTKKMDIAGG